MMALLMKDLSDLVQEGHLSFRCVLALARGNVNTVADLQKLRRREVRKIRGIGKLSMEELDAALKALGVWYRED